MFLIPNAVYVEYVAHLNKRRLTGPLAQEYVRWLRIYLEFINENPAPDLKSERVRMFIDKQRDENRSHAQLKRAAHAISLYFELQKRLTIPRDGKGDNMEPSLSPPEHLTSAATSFDLIFN